jgi:hypothetical protein
MSVDLIQLGEDIGEAQATADAALVTAEIATVAAVVENADEEHGCGEDCPCRTEARELRAMLTALTEKYDDDMDIVSEALDLLLVEEEAPELEPETGGEEDAPVEVISTEEEEDHAGRDTTPDEHESAGHGSAGGGDKRQEPEAAKAEEKHEHKHASPARRLRFSRGRR